MKKKSSTFNLWIFQVKREPEPVHVKMEQESATTPQTNNTQLPNQQFYDETSYEEGALNIQESYGNIQFFSQ